MFSHITIACSFLLHAQFINLSFLGVFTFTAPYLPWVLLGLSLMLGNSPVVDLLGMAAGGYKHMFFLALSKAFLKSLCCC